MMTVNVTAGATFRLATSGATTGTMCLQTAVVIAGEGVARRR